MRLIPPLMCLAVTGCLGSLGELSDGGSRPGDGGGASVTDSGRLDAGSVSSVDAGGPDDAGQVADGGSVPSCENTEGNAMTIAFINRFPNRTLVVSWTNEVCVPIQWGVLGPNEYMLQITLGGDRWLVKDQASGEVLFDGLAVEPSATLVFPANDAQVCSRVSDEQTVATIANRYPDRSLKLSWLDPACKEHPLETVGPRAEIAETTYVGHVFRLRRADTDEIVTESLPVVSKPESFKVPAVAPACSDEGSRPAVIGFQNTSTTRTIKVFWVDYKCKEVDLGAVPPGESLWMSTFYTHSFGVRDATTNAILVAATPVNADSSSVDVP